jgi:hypothetical protein
MKAEGYERRRLELAGWPIEVETHKLGEVYYCTINNVDPGARFARAEGTTRKDVERVALEKAQKYLKQTRKFPTGG